jgi:hypothetical protein
MKINHLATLYYAAAQFAMLDLCDEGEKLENIHLLDNYTWQDFP